MSHQAVILLVSAICFLRASTPANAALKGYDCSRNTSRAEDISILELLPPCDTIVHRRTTPAKIIQRSGTRDTAIAAYYCKVKFVQRLIDDGGSIRNVSSGTKKIGRDACLRAHKTKTLKLSGQEIPYILTDGTITHTVSLDSTDDAQKSIPFSHHKTTSDDLLSRHKMKQIRRSMVYEITLSRKESKVNLERDVVSFKGEVHCDYSSYSCREDQGEIFWTSSDLRTSENASKILYSGIVWIVGTTKSIFSKTVLYAVVQRDRKMEIAMRAFDVGEDPDDEYQTDIPNVYIKPLASPESADNPSCLQQMEGYTEPDWLLGSIHPPTPPGEILSPNWVTPPPPLPSHFEGENDSDGWDIVSTELDELVSKSFQTAYPTYSLQVSDAIEIGKRRCRNDAPDMFRRLDSVLVGSRVEYGRKGLIGIRTGGNEFSTYECEVSNVHLRKLDQRYDYLLVADEKGRDKFMNAFSRVLTDAAPTSNRLNYTCKYDMYIADESMSHEQHCDLASDWLKIVLIALVSLGAVGFLVKIVKRFLMGDRRDKFSLENRGTKQTNLVAYQAFFS